MIVVRDPQSLRKAMSRVRGRVALVPTMGCLHEGHRRLIREARKHADHVVVSIYINPLQFGADEDYSIYPRTFDEDLACCKAEGVDLIFHPFSLYAEEGPWVRMCVDAKLSGCLCGKFRTKHFDGVATVVAILFNLVQPDIAVFGEKDWQQLVIIRRMVRDMMMGVDVIACPTVRESDGLAISSRNRYLSPEARKKASLLYAALDRMRRQALAGERRCQKLISIGMEVLHRGGIAPEYLEIRAAEDLSPLDTLGGVPARAFVAARIGSARLIDNIKLEVLP